MFEEDRRDTRKLMRPEDMSHRDFMLMQKAEWEDFHRVKIGRWPHNYHKAKEIEWWCNENVVRRWFHSDGYEVYYFENANSAMLFKLRWFSELVAN